MPDDVKAIPEGGRIHETPLAGALSERYLAYAMSTIMARSLPDVRDGLKPVHRRLLWAMQQLRLDPAGGFKKCARVVGDVIGKYHPHGDASVYEALVRLAQDFAARYPLVEGQGNFGNIDGDNAAAMRYTEAKLTEVAKALLDGIDEDAVDFRPTYDGEEQEPLVLPAAFPNLLANGANGIAVGMATSIPPHNAGECCAAALELIRNPEVTTAGLLAHMPGPDFPTGGIMVEPADSILNAYETGRGGFRLRARWEKEQLKNGTWQVVVTEIPYQIQKSRLIEQIAELLEAKKLPLLADVRDESTDKVRLVLEPKSRTVEPAVLMESLFRATPLESRISLNMNVLDADRTPRVMGLKEVLRSWLDHRQVVLVRRSNYRLAAIERRLEILDGYLIVYLNLDEVIRIVREEDRPKEALIQAFGLTDNQAEAILNMRLRALRKLEEMEIRKEHTRLTKELKGLQKLLSSEKAQWDRIGEEIEAARQKFGTGPLGDRRTLQTEAVAVVFDESHFVEKEPITVILSEKGWLRAQKGHLEDPSGLRFKEGDALALMLHAETTDRIGLLASNGRAYTIKADAVPRGRGDGQPVRLMVELGNEDDIVTAFVWREGMKFLLASASGRGFVAKSEDLLAEKRTGKQALVVDAPDTLAAAVPAAGDTVAVVGENRKLLVFPLEQVPEMARGRGVALQGYRDGGLSDVKVFDARREGLTWQLGDRTRTETALAPWRGNRGGAGKMPPNGFPKSNRFDG
ncbi:DNA topoisomerase IV subunit A [Roseomonas indoligenes]|uniref:DNA topoisomerase 4 subunit A n=1 Tax=Roseomonas indoligenes TaxID=2820811 RepID=A0A940MZ02_9PROT|nr:DNA topoisomerase IV subunit A [Pararoseomonas indoligenes]MBP0492305.1 DNA topoisomerase IV subunit A [Pararoseomonas indoligenes]